MWPATTAVCLLAASLLFCRIESTDLTLDFNYHDATSLFEFLHNVNKKYPDLTDLVSIGQSVRGEQLWVLAVSARCSQRVLLRPNVKFVGNIHGDEPVGREVILHFILYLVTNYGVDDRVTRLLDQVKLHFLPSLNPDGFATASERKSGDCNFHFPGRDNAKGYDLNRGFPDLLIKSKLKRQVEVDAVIQWMDSNSFVLAASLHTGALLAVYPYGSPGRTPSHVQPGSRPTPDEDVFRHLAVLYSQTHPTMRNGLGCANKKDIRTAFPNGIVNAAAWYSVTGSMGDYSYLANGVMELSLELSCCKFPPNNQLQDIWLQNKEALMKYSFEALRGVKGIIVGVNNTALPNVSLQIEGRNMQFSTNANGEFWRILLPGTYTLLITTDMSPKTVTFSVESTSTTVLDITLVLNALVTTESDTGTSDAGMTEVTRGYAPEGTRYQEDGDDSRTILEPVTAFSTSNCAKMYSFQVLISSVILSTATHLTVQLRW